MNNNIALSQNETTNKFNTYFIHIKKSLINDLDDLDVIKSLLDDKITEEYNINDFIIMNKKELNTKSYKGIGRYLKSNKISKCTGCTLDIKVNAVFKELNCKHRFHIECIDEKLKKDIYKKCTKCLSENITMI